MSRKGSRFTGVHPTLTLAKPIVRPQPESTLVEDQEGYVPPQDRIAIRGELHVWSKIDPTAYVAYLTAQKRIESIERAARAEVAKVRRSIERMVERTRAAYPGE